MRFWIHRSEAINSNGSEIGAGEGTRTLGINLGKVDDARFAAFAECKANETELDQLIGQWTAQHEAHEAMRILQEAGVPAGPVQSQADVWEDPQLKHRGHFRWLEHTECGPMPFDGPPFALSKTPADMRTAQAMIGEHNGLILKEFLGMSDDEIADLIANEVLDTSF